MWLVGYLYNNNGMGTWCWEAAHALAAQGEPVTLVCSPDAALPGPTSLPILRIAPPPRPRSRRGKLVEALGALSSEGPRVMRSAVHAIEAAGGRVTVVLLNSTEFHDAQIPAPQLVTAWASGVSAGAYLRRLPVHLRGWTRESVRVLLGTVGWFRKDWRSYRGADVVVAVTERLQRELREHGISAEVLYPCSHASPAAPCPRPAASPMRLLIVAAVLDEPRKRVGWMLEALRDLPRGSCSLTLVGESSAALVAASGRLAIPVHFTGALPREEAVRRMASHDVLLFASTLDDWGYVIAEAMGQGLATVTPALPPFDEVAGDSGMSYAPDDPVAFAAAIRDLLPVVDAARQRSWLRARRLFSREAFAGRLRDIVAERLSHQ